MPSTWCPWRSRRAAATEESTPPDRATKIFEVVGDGTVPMIRDPCLTVIVLLIRSVYKTRERNCRECPTYFSSARRGDRYVLLCIVESACINEGGHPVGIYSGYSVSHLENYDVVIEDG